MTDPEFRGRTAVVSGAGSGIGRAMAERFVRDGMNVVLTDINRADLDAATDELRGRGGTVLAVQGDVSIAEDVAHVREEAVRELGPIHVVCANAGVVRPGNAWEQSLDDWRWILGVNLYGVVHMVHEFVPGMIEHGQPGHLVLTSSSGALTGDTSNAYTASKAAVLALAEGLQQDLALVGADRLHVSVLCPGAVSTGIYAAERNRPDRFAEKGGMSEAMQAATARYTSLIDSPDIFPPGAIADLVADSLFRSDRLYLFPLQQYLKHAIGARLARLTDTVASGPEPALAQP